MGVYRIECIICVLIVIPVIGTGSIVILIIVRCRPCIILVIIVRVSCVDLEVPLVNRTGVFVNVS